MSYAVSLLKIADHYLEEDKSSLLAIVYLEFIKGNIDLPLLKTYAEVINRFLPRHSSTLCKEDDCVQSFSQMQNLIL